MDPSVGQKAPHILILDDDTAHQELCLRAFRDDPARYRVTLAASLREAREIVKNDPPDLIIADWILPEGKGLDILPRTDGKVTTPLIVMTSFGDEHLAVEIMKSGAIDYVVKSATVFRELPHIARRALRDWENIRDRKRAEAKAQDAQKRLVDVLNFLPDAVLAIDNTGTVIGWNHAIERMTGVPAAEMLGKSDHEYSLPFYGVRRPILIDLVLMDDAEVEKQYDYIRRENGRITSETFIPSIFGGKGAYLWGTASPLFDAAGDRIGAIEVIRDITERKRTELALQKSEGRFRHISGLTSDFAYSCTRLADKTLSIDWITGACQKITGYPEEEILEMGCWRGIVAEEDLPVFDEKIVGLPQGSSSQCELRIRTKDGEIKWLRCFAKCTRDTDDQTTLRLFGGCKDITRQKNADEALLESERNLLRAQEIGHIGNWNWDIAGNRLVWSDEIYRIFGVSFDLTLTYDAITSLIHPDDRERVNLTVKDFLADGNTVESGFRIIRPDGKERWLYQKMEMVKDPSGSPKRAFGIIQDITDRKTAEQALVESEKKYRFLVDNVRDVVWQTGPDLTFTYVSPSVESRTGFSPSELTGTSLLHLLTESSAVAVRERLRERMEDFSRGSRDLATVFEIELTRKDGGTCWFEVSSNAVFGPDQSIAGFQGISRDITERKQVERALMESEARFRDLFNNMGAGVAVYEPTPSGDDFIIRNVNRAVETIEKVKKEEIVGKSVRDAFPGVVAFGLFDVFLRVSRTGIPESHPVSMYKDDRISGWRENYVYKLPSGEIVSLYEDVTEKKQAEEDRERLLVAVEEEREKLSSLVSSITDEVWFADMEHRFTLANPRALEVFGLDLTETIPVEELAGSLTVLRPDGTPRPVEEAPPLRALAGEVVRNLEEMVKTPLHGELRYRLVSAAPVRNLSETIIGSVSVVRDITEMKRAEEALKVSKAQLNEAMDLARLVNWEFDALTGIFTFNDRFYILYGTTAEREGGYQMSAEEYARRFVPPEDQGLVADSVREALEATDPTFISQVEHRIVRRDGEIRTIVVRFGIIQDENGRTVRTHGANQDITDRKRMEQALFESEAKLRRINDNAPDMIFRMSLPEGVYEYVSPASVALTG
ncbi:MAG TPA: PAS domain S-box protein, partial [Methanoregula sp.]|nr:PAS domain S-box protein [Methanoregula sp.]